MSEYILVHREGRVATLSMNRPPVNALNMALQREIAETVMALATDGETSVIVLRSAIEGVFSAGADLKEMAEREGEPQALLNMPGDPRAAARSYQFAIVDCPIPTIAAVRGYATGLGCMLIGLCDFTVAGRGAKFALPYVQIGAVAGGSQMRRVLPENFHRYMLFTGRRISAEDLHRVGAIAVLVEDTEVDQTTAEIAREIAAYDPAVVRNTKLAMENLKQLDFRWAYQHEHHWTFLLAAERRRGLKLAPQFHHHGE